VTWPQQAAVRKWLSSYGIHSPSTIQGCPGEFDGVVIAKKNKNKKITAHELFSFCGSRLTVLAAADALLHPSIPPTTASQTRSSQNESDESPRVLQRYS
jgi:hypothetical protein